VAFVFQSFNLMPTLTVRQNVVLPLTLAGKSPDRAWVSEVIERVGLGDRVRHRPSELSGGQHTTAGLPSQVVLRTDRPVAVVLPGATVSGREALGTEYDAGLGIDAWIGYLLAGIAIAYTAIASINMIAAAVLDRPREFGLQRLTGSTRRQVKAMLYLEHLVIASLGLVLGVLAAACSVLPIAVATRGWPIPSGSPWILLGWVAVVLLLVLPTTAVTARIAMRVRPMDALSSPVG
jgi:putative ABC transport system permease protein